MSIVHERAAAATATVDRIKALGVKYDRDLTPETVAEASAILAELAARKHLFPPDHFPQIRPGLSSFYRLTQDPDEDNALVVLVSSIEFVQAGFHSHPGWALIAGSTGVEYNQLYERIDNQSVEGQGRLRKLRDVAVGAGDVLFIPRGQLHTVGYDGTEPTINLHFYARTLDSPDGLQEYFATAESTEYARGPGRDRPKGVPKINAAEIVSTLANGPLEIIVLDQGSPPANLPGAPPSQNPAEVVALSGDGSPILLVGEKPAVLTAAARLVQQERRALLHASYDDAQKALSRAH